MTKNFWKKLTDPLLSIIERYSGKINSWAWDKRWKQRDPNEWIKGYREWKKNSVHITNGLFLLSLGTLLITDSN